MIAFNQQLTPSAAVAASRSSTPHLRLRCVPVEVGERPRDFGGNLGRMFTLGSALLVAAWLGPACAHATAEQSLRRCAEAQDRRSPGCYEEHVKCVAEVGRERCDSIYHVWVGDKFYDLDEFDDAGRRVSSP